jgi:hypothetical protein
VAADPDTSVPGAAARTSLRRLRWIAGAIGLVSLAAHLLAGPGHLDDVDAINFTLGVRSFDVARHQPHPPGYPVVIAAAKIVAGAAHALGGLAWAVPAPWTAIPVETAALALLAMIAGALLAVALVPLAREICDDATVVVGAVVLTLVCPLALVTASRPMSDVPGLALALEIQAILAVAFARQRGWRDRAVAGAELAASGRLVVAAALLAGVAIGVRTQTAWLTLPLLGVVIADRAGRAAAAAIVGSAVTFTAGVLLWAIPLMIVSGGPGGYWRALSSQAGDDFGNVDMLFTSGRPVWRLAMNLLQTFVLPWGPLPIAIAVLALAAIGLAALARRDRRALVLLAAAVVPYALFHLVWQENVTTRYSLPIVPSIAILALVGLRALGGLTGSAAGTWLARAGAAALAAACAVSGWPALAAYTREPAPVFRLLRDMRAAGPADAVVAMHRRPFLETARARSWVGPEGFPWRLLPAPVGHEWLELVRYWRGGGTARIWFLPDARRTDLALIDSASRLPLGHYDWSTPLAADVLGGTRPGALDWLAIDGPPAWFLGQGWALSPEIAGVSTADRTGPSAGGAVGWVRRQAVPRRLVIGGRNLGGSTDPAVRFTLSMGPTILDTWEVAPDPGFFLRSLLLPGTPETGGAPVLDEIRVTSTAADGSARVVPTAIEQFGLAPLDRVQVAFAEGWHEDELQPRTGLRWRWSSGRATLQVWPVDRDLRLRLDFESPLKTFDDAPIVTVTAGAFEVARLTPRDAFAIDAVVPAAALAASGGRIVVATSRTFVPAEHVGAGDPRHGDRRALGLRLFAASVSDAPSMTPERSR